MVSDALCKIGTTEDRVHSMFVHTRLPPIMLELSRRRGRSDAAKTLEQSQHRSTRKSTATYYILYSLFAPMLNHDHAGQNPVLRATAKLLAAQARSGFGRYGHHQQAKSARFAKAIFYWRLLPHP